MWLSGHGIFIDEEIEQFNIMRSIFFSRTIGLFLLLAIASPAAATSSNDIIIENREARAAQLRQRLEEIRTMDKSILSKSEKKALRREVREIKQGLAAISGGVYLSIGAIILIALLLILLL